MNTLLAIFVGVKVHHLNCGTLCPLGGRLFNGSRPLFRRARLVCHCLLIETEAGLVLVDTGLGLKDVGGRGRRHQGRLRLLGARLAPRDTAVSQLTAMGFSREDVRHVVLTHLDLDHAGGIADFPRARIHLLADEHQGATAGDNFRERRRYADVDWEHQPRWVLHHPLEGEQWFGFESVRGIQALPPELLIIPLRGHTRGHAGVAVDTEDGWLLHAGDAYFHYGEMNTEDPWCTPALEVLQRVAAYDNALRLQNQERLRELIRSQRGEIRVFSSHDPAELAQFGAL